MAIDFNGDWKQQIRTVLDPLIAAGANRQTRDFETARKLGIVIGKGGHGGADSDRSKVCPYCDADGNGGHGGFCPNGG